MTCGGISHGIKPPSFFRGKPKPVANSRADQHRVAFFNSPGKQYEFLAKSSFQVDLTFLFPFAGFNVITSAPFALEAGIVTRK
jgi:hypothetical protein